jgi:hypothetical protein
LWTEAHLIEFNKQVVSVSINTSGNPTDANATQSLNTMLIEPLMQQLVLVVEPV